MDTFLEEYSPLKLSQEEIVDLNRPVTISEIEFLIKKKRYVTNENPSKENISHRCPPESGLSNQLVSSGVGQQSLTARPDSRA